MPHVKPVSQQNRDYRDRLKATVVAGYGGRCSCCGDFSINRLTLHHVDNDGAAHRRELELSTTGRRRSNRAVTLHIYRDAIAAGFPAKFDVLCVTCNAVQFWHGQCHTEEEKLALRETFLKLEKK